MVVEEDLDREGNINVDFFISTMLLKDIYRPPSSGIKKNTSIHSIHNMNNPNHHLAAMNGGKSQYGGGKNRRKIVVASMCRIGIEYVRLQLFQS